MTVVLHVTAGHAFGGIESMLVTLARHQQAFPSVMHVFAVCFEGRLASDLRVAGARVVILGGASLSRPWSVVGARNRLRLYLRAAHIDVVATHGMWPHALFAPVASLMKKPVVYFAHGGASLENWADRMGRRVVPQRIIANSRFTVLHLDPFFESVDVAIVHCPVEIDRQRLTASKRAAIRWANASGPDDVVILQVSRMEHGKGQRLHLDALALLRDVRGWTCWFVGGAQTAEESAVAAEIVSHATSAGLADRVRFLGQRKDVGALLDAADVYCQPNILPDSFGITFIEAMHAGLPVITSDMGGAQEIVVPTTGVLVPPEPSAVAHALRGMIGDRTKRARLGRAARRRAVELCEPRARVAELGHLLRGLSVARNHA